MCGHTLKNEVENLSLDREEKKTYTLNDIARELGVNKATVSKAISGKGNLSAETRARILEFIDKCGYRPNAVAQSLARNRTFNIGLMMPDQAGVFDGAFFRDCLSGVCKIASANSYDVLMTMDSEQSVENIARLIDNRKIDGVIAMRSLVKSPIVGKLEAFGFHVIAIDGHDFDAIEAALNEAKTVKGQPSAIVMKTVKGKDVSYMENNAGWHGKAPNDAEYAQAMTELKALLAELEG